MVLVGGGFTGAIPDDVMHRLAEAEFEARQAYENDPRNWGLYRRLSQRLEDYFRRQ